MIVLCLGDELSAVRLQLHTDVDAMIVTRSISVRVEFEPADQSIYKDSLRFSVDKAEIELLSLDVSKQPITHYSLAFKRNKPVYTESFTATITFQAAHINAALLADAHIYGAFLVLGKDGKTRPKTLMISLGNHSKHNDHEVVQEKKLLEDAFDRDIGIVGDADSGQVKKAQAPHLSSDFALIDELCVIWRKLVGGLKSLLSSSFLIKFYCGAIALLVLLYIKRRYRWLRFVVPIGGVWEKEIKRMLFFLLGCLVFLLLSLAISHYLVLYGFAVFLLFSSFFYLKTSVLKGTFLGNLRELLGFLMAAAIFPVLIKGYLLHYSVLFNHIF